MHKQSEVALAELRGLIKADQRVAFISGNFNVVHPGHLRLLKFAADVADFLVVGVLDLPNAATIVPVDLRLENIRSISIVNYAFRLTDSPADFISALRPAIVVKGKEHGNDINPEKAVVESYGGHLLFSSGDVVFSSLDLLRREFNEFSPHAVRKPREFPIRHGFDDQDIRATIAKFSDLRILVLGDVIVDEYIACDALGMSQEDPSIVVTPLLTERFVGGAGIVAGHASRLGVQSRFISVVGFDDAADYADKQLKSYGVETTLLRDESRPTTLKQRYRAGGKTLLRVSHLKQHDIEQALQQRVTDAVAAALPNTDLLMFADFNYGILPQPMVEAIATLAAAANVPMVADSQSSSQVGDISRFRNMLLLKPTEREARIALRDFNSGLVVLAESLRDRTDAKNIVLTLGAEGLLIHATSRQEEQGWITDQLPAFNTSPKDTAGAGDSFFVLSSLALIAGANIWQSAYIGALAAACQVGRIGNVPLTQADILRELGA